MGMLGVKNFATVSQLDGKVDKVTGKGLSTEDYSTSEKEKLAGIQTGAQVNPDLTPYATTAAVSAALAGKSDTGHGHAISDVSGLQSALDSKASSSHGHAIGDVTGLQTALDGKQAALGFTPENAASKGQANGYASLDSSGLVPSAQLPSYVDDVIEYENYAALPATGEAGKIYVLATPHTSGDVTSSQFRWAGSAYAPIIASPGSTDSVAEGSLNKYFLESRVLDTLLTGISFATNAAVTAADSLKIAAGKLQAQINALITGKANASFSLGTAIATASPAATTITVPFSAGHYAIYRAASNAYGTIHIPSDMIDGATIYGGCVLAVAPNATSYVMVTRSGSDMIFRHRYVSTTVVDSAFDAVYKLT